MFSTELPETAATSAPRSFGRAAVVGVLAGTALAVAVHVLARLVGDDLVVAPPGQPSGSVPLGAVIGAALVGALLAVVAALVARRTPRPRLVFTVLAAVGLVVSFTSPIGAAQTASTAWWLALMHVGVAAGVVPALRRALPAVRA